MIPIFGRFFLISTLSNCYCCPNSSHLTSYILSSFNMLQIEVKINSTSILFSLNEPSYTDSAAVSFDRHNSTIFFPRCFIFPIVTICWFLDYMNIFSLYKISSFWAFVPRFYFSAFKCVGFIFFPKVFIVRVLIDKYLNHFFIKPFQ